MTLINQILLVTVSGATPGNYDLTRKKPGDWNMSLANCGVYLRSGLPLFGGPSIRSDLVQFPAAGGSKVSVRSHDHRDVVLNLMVMAEDPDDLPFAISELVNAVDPVGNGSGSYPNDATVKLYVRTGASLTLDVADETRYLEGHIVTGGPVSIVHETATTAAVTMILRSSSPYWRQTAAASGSVNLAVGAAPVSFTDYNAGQPFPTGTVVGDFDEWATATIVVPAGVVAWLTYSVTGSAATFSKGFVAHDVSETAANFDSSILVTTEPHTRTSTGKAPSVFAPLTVGTNKIYAGIDRATGSNPFTLDWQYDQLHKTAVG